MYYTVSSFRILCVEIWTGISYNVHVIYCEQKIIVYRIKVDNSN